MSANVIEHYESLSLITHKMREAAAAGDWERLIELEKQSSALVTEMKVMDLAPSNETTRLQKLALIKQILADDAAIRSKTELWMSQLQRIMDSARTEVRLNKAYSAV